MTTLLFSQAPLPLAEEWRWMLPALFTLGSMSALSLAILLIPASWHPPPPRPAGSVARFMLHLHAVQLVEGMAAGRILVEGILDDQPFALLWPEQDNASGLTVIEQEWSLNATDLTPQTLGLEFAVRCGKEGHRWELFSDPILVDFNPIEGPAHGSIYLYAWSENSRWPRPCGIIQYSLRTEGRWKAHA